MGKVEKIKALWKDRDNQKAYAKWLIEYTKPYFWKIVLVVLIGTASTFITLAMALISKRIIDVATSSSDNGGNIMNNIVFLIVVYAVLIISTQGIMVASTLLNAVVTERFSFGIRKQIYDKILQSSWIKVQYYHTGDLMTRLTSDAGAVADGIVSTIPSIVTLFVELVVVFFTLFYYSPLLAIFALIIAPVAVICCGWLGKRLKKLQIKVLESESNYRSFLQESIANLMVMKAFSNEEYASNRLADLREERFYWVFKKTKFGLVSSSVMSLSFQAGYIVAFTYGALQVSAKAITYGTMSVFLTLVNRVQSPVMELARKIPQVVSILASAGRIIEIQDIDLEDYPETELTQNIGMKMEHVSFGYTDEIVLNDISLDIKPGEMIAIVGESGIGKTTLIRLGMAFLEANEGNITFYDEMGREEKSTAGSRKFLSYVPQGNTLFSGTIRENIRMGRLDASETEMWEALELASGAEFVKKLPQGLDTRIGEKGHGLSEGQAQRIAIARALVRKAPFLILDEATSALDEMTELKVLEGINSVQPKPTCLVITHRRSVLKYCDHEIKIENRSAEEN